MAERLDIVIFGASGFTGKHVVITLHKLTKECNMTITWGIAGRSKSKLESVFDFCKEKTDDDISYIKTIIADVNDEESLKEMTKQARVIVNCCGPYRLYGEAVIKACLQTKTHHVDVSAETPFMEGMQLMHHGTAMERAVYIVSCCGLDSIPADLGVVFLQNIFKGTVNSVEVYIKISPNINHAAMCIPHGSWESVVRGSSDAKQLKSIRPKLFTNPLPNFEPKLKPRCFLHRSNTMDNQWAVSFCDSNNSVITRSQRYFYEHDKKRPIQIETYFILPKLLMSFSLLIFGIIFAVLYKFKFGRNLLLKYPKFFTAGYYSNEDPIEKPNEYFEFSLTFVAKGWSNNKPVSSLDSNSNTPNKTVITRISGKDPGYGFGTTASILLLSALTIIREADKMPNNGGVYPPAAAFAKTSMIEKLQKILKFEVISVNEE